MTTFLYREWPDFDEISHADAEQHSNYEHVVETETEVKFQYGEVPRQK